MSGKAMSRRQRNGFAPGRFGEHSTVISNWATPAFGWYFGDCAADPVDPNRVYILGLNIRRSTIMGLVGAGGLGLALHRQMASYNYGGIATVIFVILLLIIFGELFSAWARKKVI